MAWTWKTVQDVVEDADGIASIEMRYLRDALDVKKLGPHVVAKISSELANHGLAHWPPELPEAQNALVLVFAAGSKMGKAIKSLETRDVKAARFLRDHVFNDAGEKLDQIRELLG